MHVSRLFYYPVKSLGVVETNKLEVTAWGPDRDRRLMLVDENGKFVTQRQHNEMTLIKTEDDGKTLTFKNADETFTLPWPDFSAKGTQKTVRVWDDEVTGSLASDEADQWFSKQLNRPVSLVYMSENTTRQVDLDFAQEGDKTGFSDGFPFLLISEASLAFLQNELPFELTMNRFRPNIVVKGCDAFAEDNWKRIAINGIEFEIVKSCSRCAIPTINPETAERQPEVMKVLVKHRKQGNKVYLGQNLIHRGQGLINAGDDIQLLE